jgi:hypothetical protein
VITIDLHGGLGNQLFQWALGVSLAKRGQQVQYNTKGLDEDESRSYLLGDLGLNLPLVSDAEPTFTEESMRFNPAVLEMTEGVLHGYWQCEKYFLDVQDEVRKMAFENLERCTETWKAAFSIRAVKENSCFLHVRRSDNLRPRSIMYHGLTSAVDNPYYERAKAMMREHVPHAVFFVFSDDPDWCRENMKQPDMRIVSHNRPSFTVKPDFDLIKNSNGREVEDLWLMSLCQHAIIANSTFSHWGAWLNLGEGKTDRIVIAPDPWFGTGTLDSQDIIPDRWTKVSMR